jgi:hypothetical protein
MPVIIDDTDNKYGKFIVPTEQPAHIIPVPEQEGGEVYKPIMSMGEIVDSESLENSMLRIANAIESIDNMVTLILSYVKELRHEQS